MGYVNSNFSEPGFNQTSPQTVTLTGTTAGNLICVMVFFQGGSSLTINTPTDGSNTYHPCAASTRAYDSGTATQVSTFYASGIAGGSAVISCSYTSPPNAYIGIYAFELSGVNAYDTGAVGVGTTATNATTGNWTSNFSNETIVAATINGNNATGAGPGYSLIRITSNYDDCMEYAAGVSAGTQNTQAVMGGSDQSWNIAAAGFYMATPVTVAKPTDTLFFGMT